MKLDMCFKNIKKTYNSTVRFSKYVIMLIYLVKVVVLDYNKFVVKLWSLEQYTRLLQTQWKSLRKILLN